jgi:mannose-6-phosphate isomerase-like protein (cupin superfamily)
MSEDRVLRLPAGELISIIRTGSETEGEVFEFEAVLPSGLSGPPAHWHRVEQEAFEVVEGRLRVRVGHAVRYLGPGESLVVAPGIVHAFSNPTGEQVRVITRETPAGQLEGTAARNGVGWQAAAVAAAGRSQRRERFLVLPGRRARVSAAPAVARSRRTGASPETPVTRARRGPGGGMRRRPRPAGSGMRFSGMAQASSGATA